LWVIQVPEKSTLYLTRLKIVVSDECSSFLR
jgi:hypothetical protein